jgi:hypothetical protein
MIFFLSHDFLHFVVDLASTSGSSPVLLRSSRRAVKSCSGRRLLFGRGLSAGCVTVCLRGLRHLEPTVFVKIAPPPVLTRCVSPSAGSSARGQLDLDLSQLSGSAWVAFVVQLGFISCIARLGFFDRFNWFVALFLQSVLVE